MTTTLKTDLLALAELESDDPELIPDIIPLDAKLSFKGPVLTILGAFERVVSVIPAKELVPGTIYAQIDAVAATATSVAHVRITATDGDQSLSVVTDGVVVNTPGSARVPGRKITEMLKNAPDDLVRIEVVGTSAIVRSGQIQWTLQTPTTGELPPLPDVSGIELHNVDVDTFYNALATARLAASNSTARPSLMQVKVSQGMATGMDGGRLHRQTIPDFPKDLALDIPVKVADEVLKMLRNTDSEKIELGANNYHLVFRLGRDFLIAQRLLVSYPDVEKLILAPAFANTGTLIVNRLDLMDVIRRVRINADPEYSAIFLLVVPKGPGWSLAVRARDRTGNTAQELIDAAWQGSDKIPELCVNHRYLTEFLAAYDGDDCFFKLGEDTKSVRSPLFIEDKVVGFTGFVQQMNPSWF